MKKSMNYLIWLTIQVVCVFVVAILATYIGEFLQSSGFFGDVPCKGRCGGAFDETMDWGPRHYWYFWMSVSLFLLSVVRIIMWSVNYWEETK